MKKVYVVTYGNYDMVDVIGVYTTKLSAVTRANAVAAVRYSWAYVEVHEAATNTDFESLDNLVYQTRGRRT